MSERISTTAAFEDTYPDALAVYCSDGRFTHAVAELLGKLGHPRLDLLTVPGGPGLLNHKTCGYSDCDSFSRSAEFLIRAHHVTTVVLLAHEGCGFYGQKFSDLTPAQIRQRQVDDLRFAMRELLETHPRLRALAYVAMPHDGHVDFEPVDK